jgi:hypothetical protein
MLEASNLAHCFPLGTELVLKAIIRGNKNLQSGKRLILSE